MRSTHFHSTALTSLPFGSVPLPSSALHCPHVHSSPILATPMLSLICHSYWQKRGAGVEPATSMVMPPCALPSELPPHVDTLAFRWPAIHSDPFTPRAMLYRPCNAVRSIPLQSIAILCCPMQAVASRSTPLLCLHILSVPVPSSPMLLSPLLSTQLHSYPSHSYAFPSLTTFASFWQRWYKHTCPSFFTWCSSTSQYGQRGSVRVDATARPTLSV